MRKFWLLAAALVLNLSLTAVVSAAVRDCDGNAIVYCGAETQAELLQKLHEGDNGGHDGASLTYVFAAHGISASQISQTVIGAVTKDGRVLVGGQTVATGARSVGRQNIPGSSPDGELWIRPTSVSFLNDSLTAFVYMPNNRFAWAVLTSCGNPVSATPVAPPPAPAPVTPSAAPPPPPPPIVTIAASKPLPSTGAGSWLAMLGFAACGFAVRGYYASRQRLIKSLHGS